MAKEFVRNIKNTKLDSNEELKEPLYTNVQNDLLSDKKHAYIRNNDFYFPITKSILNVTEDSNIKNPLEYTKVIDGRTNEVTSHWNFNKLNNNFESTLPITKSTNNETITYGLSYPSLFNHFKFDNVFLSASQDGDDIKIKFTPDVIYEKTNQDMMDKLEYLENSMGKNLDTNLSEKFEQMINDKFAKKESNSSVVIPDYLLANKVNMQQSSIEDKGGKWAVPLNTDSSYYLVWEGVKISFIKYESSDKDDNFFIIDRDKLKNENNLLANSNNNYSNTKIIGYRILNGKIYIDKVKIDEYLELERTAIIVNMNKATSPQPTNNYAELQNKIDLQNLVITEMGKRLEEMKTQVYQNKQIVQQHSQDIINLSKRISG